MKKDKGKKQRPPTADSENLGPKLYAHTLLDASLFLCTRTLWVSRAKVLDGKATRWSALNRSTDGIHVVSILRSRYRHNAGCGAVGAGAKLLQDASCSMASFHASVGSGCAGKLPAVLQPRLSRMGKAPLNRSNVVTNETLCCGAAVESHKMWHPQNSSLQYSVTRVTNFC